MCKTRITVLVNLHGGAGLAGLPLSKTMRQTLCSSSLHTELKRAKVLPAGPQMQPAHMPTGLDYDQRF
jgi:hypothetical protein